MTINKKDYLISIFNMVLLLIVNYLLFNLNIFKFTNYINFLILVAFTCVTFGINIFLIRKKNNHIASQTLGLNAELDILFGMIEEIQMSSKDIEAISIDQSEALIQNQEVISTVDQKRVSNKDNIDKAYNYSLENNQKIKSANVSINKLYNLMNKIVDSNDTLKKQTIKNSNEYTKVSDIISEIEVKTKVINDMAMETKILAFNASVEAAQAGAKGKGFAVVAEEIGNLANMSDRASKEITAILQKGIGIIKKTITDTQEDNSKIVELISSNVNLGMQSTEEAQYLFKDLENSLHDLANSITSITKSNDDLSSDLESFQNLSTTFDLLIQKNRLTSSQSIFISKSLSDDVKLVCNKIKNFQVLFYNENNVPTSKIPIMAWSNAYSIGVPKMDLEHQELIKRINSFISKLNLNNTNEIKSSYKYLLEYVVEHFTDEEKFMASIELPELNAHKKIHEKLVNRALAFQEQINKDTLDNNQVASFLKNWLVSHILGIDKRYGEFYQKNFR